MEIVALDERIHVAGSVVFSDDQRAAFSSALPLTAALERSMVFSHIASDATYYTGISLLNPDIVAATVTIEVYQGRWNPCRKAGSYNRAKEKDNRTPDRTLPVPEGPGLDFGICARNRRQRHIRFCLVRNA